MRTVLTKVGSDAQAVKNHYNLVQTHAPFGALKDAQIMKVRLLGECFH